MISFVDTRQRSKTVDELWRMWSVGERNGQGLSAEEAAEVDRLLDSEASIRSVIRQSGRGYRAVTRQLTEGTTAFGDARWRVRRMKLRVLNEETREFEVGHICDVIDKGIQPVYRITLADGKQLTATESHLLLTDEGWKTLHEAVGLEGAGKVAATTRDCRLLVNGVAVYRDYEWMKTARDRGLSVSQMAESAGCSYPTIRSWLRRHDLKFTPEERNFPRGHTPWNKSVKGYRLSRRWTEEQKDAIRAARSGEKSNFWRGGISSERASVARWTTEQAPKVHHQYDYTCHARIHRTQETELAFATEFAPYLGFAQEAVDLPQRKGCKLTAHAARVVAVEYLGLRQTYDLAVEGPWHNFVANGIVVHNSFNEESARYHQLEGDFYVPAPEDVRSQVGKPGAYTFDPVDPGTAEAVRTGLAAQYEQAYRLYQELIDRGLAKELARCVLPMGTFTQFYWTVNARSLMNFLSLRAADTAQLEIRRYAEAIETFFAELMPATYEAFVDNGRVAP